MTYVQISPRLRVRSTQTDLQPPLQPPFTQAIFDTNTPFIPQSFLDPNHYIVSQPHIPVPAPAPIFAQQPQLEMASQHFGAFPTDGPYYNNGAVFPMAFGPIQTDLPPPGFNPDALHPFEDPSLKYGPTNYGVIRIKNIPYSVTKSEVIHFLGRHAPTITPHLHGNPIHIIMERSTAKTMDCYVELLTPLDANHQAERHEALLISGKPPKLGTRHVGVEVASQDDLLADLFPRAKSIMWQEGIPIVLKNNDPYSGGFHGFFTLEEMVGLVRHAENPQRSPFSSKCLQRTYECTISTLYKFPWFAPHLYTLYSRNVLFNTYRSQLQVLVDKVGDSQTVGLDHKLLMDFIFAGMNCVGFGERQKFELASAAQRWGAGVNISYLSGWWPFEVLTRRVAGIGEMELDDGTVRFYLDLIELGVQTLLSSSSHSDISPFPFSQYITFRLPSQQVSQDPFALNNTQFHFLSSAERYPFETLMSMEMCLMGQLLETGWEQWQTDHGVMNAVQIRIKAPEQIQNIAAQALAEKMEMLQLQRRELERAEEEALMQQANEEDHFDDGAVYSQNPKTSQETHLATHASTPPSPNDSDSNVNATMNNEILSKNAITADLEKPRSASVNIHPLSSPTIHPPILPSNIDPTSAPFEPRKRFLSDPQSRSSTCNANNLGFGLGNGDFTASAFSTPRKNNGGGSAIRIHNPDGTPAIFFGGGHGNLQPTNVTHEDAPTALGGGLSSPSSSITPDTLASSPANNDQNHGVGGEDVGHRVTNTNVNTTYTPTKMPRGFVQVNSTITEEKEVHSEGDEADDEDGDADQVLMGTGRERAMGVGRGKQRATSTSKL